MSLKDLSPRPPTSKTRPTRIFFAWATTGAPGIAHSIIVITTSTAAATRTLALILCAPPRNHRSDCLGLAEVHFESPPGTPGIPRVRLGGRGSRARSEEVVEFVQPYENIARSAALGRTDNTLFFQLVDDAGGADVADLHLALQQRHRPIPGPHGQSRGLGQEGILIPAGFRATLLGVQEVLVEDWPALGLPPRDQRVDLAIGDECALGADRPRGAHR